MYRNRNPSLFLSSLDHKMDVFIFFFTRGRIDVYMYVV